MSFLKVFPLGHLKTPVVGLQDNGTTEKVKQPTTTLPFTGNGFSAHILLSPAWLEFV